jgi:phytoene dehydrogenase-like protein
MKTYDHLVVGGGISGLTLSLLLANNNKKVLLLEKGPHIGGSLTRFYKNNIPFDTGFHFTGGFSRGGILTDMLHALGIAKFIQPIFLNRPGSALFVFEKDNLTYDMPSGTENFCLKLKEYFPQESGAIDAYFAKVKKVYQSTVSLDIRKLTLISENLDEDYVSLQAVLDSLTNNQHLKGLLSAFCVCYGVKPTETSFANHARVAGGLYESVARIQNGGEAFIRAFNTCFKDVNIDILCKTTIAECAQIKDDTVGEFILTNGDTIKADNCTFTIHPHEILKVLPRLYLRKAFIERVSAFQTSHGFFCTCGSAL